jgi:hypothetical protein
MKFDDDLGTYGVPGCLFVLILLILTVLLMAITVIVRM